MATKEVESGTVTKVEARTNTARDRGTRAKTTELRVEARVAKTLARTTLVPRVVATSEVEKTSEARATTSASSNKDSNRIKDSGANSSSKIRINGDSNSRDKKVAVISGDNRDNSSKDSRTISGDSNNKDKKVVVISGDSSKAKRVATSGDSKKARKVETNGAKKEATTRVVISKAGANSRKEATKVRKVVISGVDKKEAMINGDNNIKEERVVTSGASNNKVNNSKVSGDSSNKGKREETKVATELRRETTEGATDSRMAAVAKVTLTLEARVGAILAATPIAVVARVGKRVFSRLLAMHF